MEDDEGDLCAICQTAFVETADDSKTSIAECGHKFHAPCLLKWEVSAPKPSCPLCRVSYAESAIKCVDMCVVHGAIPAGADGWHRCVMPHCARYRPLVCKGPCDHAQTTKTSPLLNVTVARVHRRLKTIYRKRHVVSAEMRRHTLNGICLHCKHSVFFAWSELDKPITSCPSCHRHFAAGAAGTSPPSTAPPRNDPTRSSASSGTTP
jgi:hypothetical protein